MIGNERLILLARTLPQQQITVPIGLRAQAGPKEKGIHPHSGLPDRRDSPHTKWQGRIRRLSEAGPGAQDR